MLMAARDISTAVSDQIVQAFGPEQIILFGSHAYGTPHADSDVDLLVIMRRVFTRSNASKNS